MYTSIVEFSKTTRSGEGGQHAGHDYTTAAPAKRRKKCDRVIMRKRRRSSAGKTSGRSLALESAREQVCVHIIGNVRATQSYSLAYRSQAAVVGRIGRSAGCRGVSNNLINTVGGAKYVDKDSYILMRNGARVARTYFQLEE